MFYRDVINWTESIGMTRKGSCLYQMKTRRKRQLRLFSIEKQQQAEVGIC